MTKDETIDRLWGNSNHGTRREDVETAYNAGAIAEREACAKECDKESTVTTINGSDEYNTGRQMGATVCATVIRLRSNDKIEQPPTK